jgi:hypothetical protein
MNGDGGKLELFVYARQARSAQVRRLEWEFLGPLGLVERGGELQKVECFLPSAAGRATLTPDENHNACDSVQTKRELFVKLSAASESQKSPRDKQCERGAKAAAEEEVNEVIITDKCQECPPESPEWLPTDCNRKLSNQRHVGVKCGAQ